MSAGSVSKRLDDNDKAHDELNSKIEGIKEKMHSNHIELLNAIHSNKLDMEKTKERYGIISGAVTVVTLLGDYIIRKF